jgi:hypothetical protein
MMCDIVWTELTQSHAHDHAHFIDLDLKESRLMPHAHDHTVTVTDNLWTRSPDLKLKESHTRRSRSRIIYLDARVTPAANAFYLSNLLSDGWKRWCHTSLYSLTIGKIWAPDSTWLHYMEWGAGLWQHFMYGSSKQVGVIVGTRTKSAAPECKL